LRYKFLNYNRFARVPITLVNTTVKQSFQLQSIDAERRENQYFLLIHVSHLYSVSLVNVFPDAFAPVESFALWF